MHPELDVLIAKAAKGIRTNNPDMIGEAATELLSHVLSDIKRIADALEKISNFELRGERINNIATLFMGIKADKENE